MSLDDNQSDKGDLEWRLKNFSVGDQEFMEITRIEAKYLSELVNADWHGRVKR